MSIPTDPNILLERKSGASALTEAGYPISPATLATKASRGGGPVYHYFGRRVLYRWGDLFDWAQSRLSPPVTSTAELDRMRRMPPESAASRPEPAQPVSAPEYKSA